MTQKSILFLGAAPFQIPPIQYALRAGYRVITCDNRPENAGHKMAHVSHYVSTLELMSILQIAEHERIDGILSFGSDVSAYTAAFVAKEMDLPGNPPESILTLCQKHRFRKRLHETGVHTFKGASFSASEFDNAVAFARSLLPGEVVIKPVDASGSKGVSICSSDDQISASVRAALSRSVTSMVVVEDRVPRLGYQICGDGYFQDGAIAFIQYGNGHFYGGTDRLAPYGESFPSAHPAALLKSVTLKLEVALRACGFSHGPFNFDVLIDARDRTPFIVEIGPRSGGNYLPTVIRYHSGVDLIEAAVEGCLRSRYRLTSQPKESATFHSSFMLHATESGTYRGFELQDGIHARVLEHNPYLSMGDTYKPFVNAADALGNLILAFDDYEVMLQSMNHPSRVAILS